MKTLKLVAAIAALTGSMATNAANIDLFTDPAGTTKVTLNAVVDNTNSTITDSSGGVLVKATSLTGTVADLTPSSDFKESSDGGSGSILGGYRDMEIELISLETDTATDAGAELKVSQTLTGLGRLTLDSDDGIVAKGTVHWDGNDNSATLDTNGFNEDITDGGASDRFVFQVVSADLDFNFSIALFDADGSSVIFDLAANLGPHISEITFDQFNSAFALTGGCGGSAGPIPALGINSMSCTLGTTAGIDFEKITAMELVLNTSGLAGATASLDMTIGGIQTVPEPSSVALIGLGLLATGFANKRKSKKA
mgnify:CR=1 FL=1